MEAALDEPAHDERMRRLQRIAYGAVASDRERAAALAELEALRREAAEAAARPRPQAAAPGPMRCDADRIHPRGRRVDRGLRRGIRAPVPLGHRRRHRGAPRRRRRRLALGARMGPSDAGAIDQALGGSPPMPAPRCTRSRTTEPLPVVDSAAVRRLRSAAPRRPTRRTSGATTGTRAALDPATLRLLATTPGGVGVYGAKPLPGAQAGASGPADVCLVVASPTESPAPARRTACSLMDDCGRRPPSEGAGPVRAVWHADGTVQVTVPTRVTPDRELSRSSRRARRATPAPCRGRSRAR